MTILGLAVLVALGSDKALTGTARFNGGGDQWRFRLRLFASEPIIQRDPSSPSGVMDLTIPTYGAVVGQAVWPGGESRTAASGRAALPVKVVRVAIPEGTSVRLDSIQGEPRILKGLRLGPEEAQALGRAGAETGPTATGVARETDTDSLPVRLGQTGYLRFQKFVEVVYTPVVAGDAGDHSFFSDLDVELVVDETLAPSQAAAVGASPDDPFFEDIYRSAFINYDEGRSFRNSSTAPAAAASLAAGAQGIAPAFAAAVTPIYRVGVRASGIYRLTHAYLLAPGTGVAPGLAGLPPAQIKLISRGVEVPIRIVGGGDGTFDPGDYVEFYGEPIIGEPELLLNFDFDSIGQPNVADIFQANDVTDEAIYFLFGEPGTRARIPNLAGAFTPGPPIESSFAETLRREFDTIFVPDGINDPLYQKPGLLSNSGSFSADPNAPNCGYVNTPVQNLGEFLGPGFASTNKHFCPACDLQLPGVLNIPDSATVRVRLRGATSDNNVPVDHMTVVQVGTNAARSATVCWDGEAVVTATVSVPQSELASGAGIFVAQPGLAATVGAEGLFMDFIEVDYRRSLRLTSRELRARFTNADRSYDLAGFPTNIGADVIVYDVSRQVPGVTVASPRLVTGGSLSGAAGDFTLRFTLAADGALPPGAPRLLAAAGDLGFRLPARFEQVAGEDLTLVTNAADMLVITTPTAADLTPGSPFMNYLSHRAAGSGITVRTVMMRDIYDQFSDGIETPEALRRFLLYAFDNWRGPSSNAAPPAYVMLVGDISLDYKNDLGNAAWVNQVPTFVMYWQGPVLDYYASDAFIAAFRGTDQLPDIHLGRISSRNPAESAVIFQKLLDYDTIPPAGTWRSNGVFLADQGDFPAETADFENTQSGVANTFFATPFSNQRLYFEDPNYANGGSPGAWRTDYTSKANAGAAWTSFFGHGSFDIWGSALFSSADLAAFTPSRKPTFLINENCLSGGFHNFSSDSLGEAFLKAADKGAIAVLAPSGLSFSTVAHPINDAIYPAMFGLTKERRFGHIMTLARLDLDFTIPDLQAYVLLGDPAQRLILPAPRPPVSFDAATGLDARVDLSWSPGPDPGVLTRIYRATNPAGAYTLLTPSGISATSYSDTAVINGIPYFYRATSVDAGNVFEGAVTNLNDDCSVADPNSSGPRCVWARPINPNPPSTPGGFRIVNPGRGNQLDARWNLGPEPDLLRYTLRYSTTQGGPYGTSVDVPAPGTVVQVGGLAQGTPYFFILTATNRSGNTSPATSEAAGTPLVFEGSNPPDQIIDLDVRRSTSFPDSLQLSWSPPATDIYGGPVTLGSYSIYRGTSPRFVPDPGNRIATVSATQTSYVDPGSFVAPGSFYYLITATDVAGFTSGAALQLPLGVSDLHVVRAGANLNLSWNAVGVDVDGMPTFVDHYELYSDTQPLTPARIRQLTPLVGSITGTSVSIPAPAGSLNYLSVIVVDIRGNKSPF